MFIHNTVTTILSTVLVPTRQISTWISRTQLVKQDRCPPIILHPDSNFSPLLWLFCIFLNRSRAWTLLGYFLGHFFIPMTLTSVITWVIGDVVIALSFCKHGSIKGYDIFSNMFSCLHDRIPILVLLGSRNKVLLSVYETLLYILSMRNLTYKGVIMTSKPMESLSTIVPQVSLYSTLPLLFLTRTSGRLGQQITVIRDIHTRRKSLSKRRNRDQAYFSLLVSGPIKYTDRSTAPCIN